MRKLTIMRGQSGSGKSTYAKKHFPEALQCSADHFFYGPDGSYTFDPKRLGAAHAACHDKVKRAMISGEEHIVLDNTNTRLREMKPYLKLAKEFNYEVDFVRLETPVDVAAKRNLHGVPEDKVAQMKARMVDIPGEKIVEGV